MNSQNFINGLIVGVLAGLAVGMLFSPEKGSEIRRIIGEKGGDLADALKDKFRSYANEAKDFAENASDKAKDLYNEGKNKADQFSDRASSAFSS